MNRVIQNTTLSLLSITIFSGLLLSSTHAYSDTEVIDEIRLTVPVACTMSGTGTTHAATLNPGTYSGTSGSEYENGIGKTTLTAICNDDNGFSIYAIGFTGNQYEGENHTKLVGTNTNGTIATKAYASGDTTSNWSMKLTKVTNPGSGDPITYNPENLTITTNYDNWIAVPATYTKVAEYKTNTGSSATDTTLGVKLETTYAAYIASNQAADTYVGQVKYTMVHPYNAAEPLVCKPNGTTISTIKCMQDISSINKTTVLSSMTEDQQYNLRDKRDGKTYTVSKLKDGNIWMTQNLDLDLDSNTTYTNEDTDIGWNTSTNSYDTASWTPLRSTYETTIKTWCQGSTWNSQNSCQNNYTPESYNPGNLYWNGTLSNNNDWNTYSNSCILDSTTHESTCDESLNPINTYTTSLSTPNPEYYLGNYYNWTAAVAMNDSSTYTTNNQDVNQSICPSGWTLPKSGNSTSNGSFRYLFELYGGSNNSMTNPYIWNSAIKLPLTGHWYASSKGIGGYGYYWSPVVADSGVAYFNVAGSNGYVGSGGWGRGDGNSIRCLTR